MPDQSDPYSGYNAMQAHMGVMPMTSVAPPGVAAQMMISQANQQRAYAVSAGLPIHGQSHAMGAASMVGDQFRQRFEHIQSQQSFNPYMAHAMSQGTTPGFMPSPLMMTPPSTGVYGTRPEGPRFMPLPPQPMMPMFQTPFTPQLPPPMFQHGQDQAYRRQDAQADRTFAHAMQAPRLFGAGLGMGASAFIGGAAAGPVGAIAGGALGYASGFSGGMGNMMMRPFQPMMEQRQMGAAIRDFSQNWVTTGHDRHQSGSGFSREASLRLAEGIQDLSKDRAFKRETGGMFNQSDLMGITREAGRAGLMDESQDVEGVRKNIKNVSRTLKKYMQLTQDPDMVSVLRELGQMKQFGMTLEDMEQAASSMRRYSKAAGTSIAGIKQMGLYGGATFQQAGLTAGAGMTYGMHAAAASRQAVATGTFEPRELALMGGVQGMTQRNIQAQAAMFSMPLFGAAVAGYGAGGFNLNQNNLQGMMSGGAVGMVNQAVGNMGSAVSQGGVGALAMFPLQQRRVQTMAAEQLTPEQGMAMRFQSAYQTGQQLGLQGHGAFAAGARMHFGDEVAEQMMYEAQNPAFFQEQRNRIGDRRQELVAEQRTRAEANRPSGARLAGRHWVRGMGFQAMGEGIGHAGRAIGGGLSQVGSAARSLGHTISDIQAESEGRYVRRMSGDAVYSGHEERRDYASLDQGVLDAAMGEQRFTGGIQPRFSGKLVSQAATYGGAYTGHAAYAGAMAMDMANPIGALTRKMFGVDALPGAALESAMGAGLTAAMGQDATTRMVVKQATEAMSFTKMAEYGGTKGGTREGVKEVMAALDASSKGKVSSGAVLNRASEALASAIKSKQNVFLPDGTLNTSEVRKIVYNSLKADGLSEGQIKETLDDLEKSGGFTKLGGVMLDQARNIAGPEFEGVIQKSIEQAQIIPLKTMDQTQDRILERKKFVKDRLEDQLDLTFDVGGFGYGDKAGADEVRAMMATGPAGMLAKVAAVSGGEARVAALAEYKRLHAGSGKSEKELDDEFELAISDERRKLPSMSSDAKKRLQKIGAGGDTGSIETAMRTLTQTAARTADYKEYAAMTEGAKSLLGSLGGDAAGRMIELGATTGYTGGGIADALGESGAADLFRAGHKDLARDVARLRKGELSDEERKKLESSVQKRVAGMGEASTRHEKVLGVATGEEARRLDESDKALGSVQSEMAAAFRDFKPAARKFAEGADKFERAMQLDVWKNIGGN